MSRIALAGGSGFVGAALRRHWASRGVEVVQLVRRPAATDLEIEWDPEMGRLDAARLADCEVLVNLAGASIAAGRWTARRKRLIRESRVRPTQVLAATLQEGAWRPRVWINASAIGYYGDGGERELDESSPQGAGFLASVCADWEAATRPAEVAGVRVVRLRLGVVLDCAGGALAKLLPVYRAGLGGPLGDGRAWMSVIALDELCRVVDTVAGEACLAGAVNAVSPAPVRNADFAAALGRGLRRPAWVRTPAWLIRGLLGEMGRETLLASQRAVPRALLACGHRFRPADPDGLLRGAGLGHPG